jgi:hypothetical protein
LLVGVVCIGWLAVDITDAGNRVKANVAAARAQTTAFGDTARAHVQRESKFVALAALAPLMPRLVGEALAKAVIGPALESITALALLVFALVTIAGIVLFLSAPMGTRRRMLLLLVPSALAYLREWLGW